MTQKTLSIGTTSLSLNDTLSFVFERNLFTSILLEEPVRLRVKKSHEFFLNLLEKRIPIYGVTTGFGDSCHRALEPSQSEELQKNLIEYLSCATGPAISKEASRATFLIRLKSLSRGYSGVSIELLERMKLFLENDWIPVVPREGSLGASGDLIPLAYIARVLQGQGDIHTDQGAQPVIKFMKEAGVAPYVLKPKEGLAIVNGTSTMAGTSLVNLKHAQNLVELQEVATAWMVLALGGKLEAFSELVNEKAKSHRGQSESAKIVRDLLRDEDYQPRAGQDVKIQNQLTEEFIQDRYSVRCAPQIMGPIRETLDLVWSWLETEINSTSDNPLIDDDGRLGMGGNFYGGHLSQGMDYVKIGLAHQSDLLDRQLALLIDEKSNRGLTPNLANWSALSESEKHLHHGLKGLHQSVSAITSEIMAKAIPNGIFSRSSESHNQDKVSLGMSAASQCADMIEQVYTVQTMHLICLAQALELRGIKLKGARSQRLFNVIRKQVPFISRDTSLGTQIQNLKTVFQSMKSGELV